MASGSQQIIVDNRSPGFLSYVGPWDHQGRYMEFNETSSFALGTGANVTLQFSGTAVAAYGTWGEGGNSTSVTYFLDDSPVENVTLDVIDNQGDVPHHIFFGANMTDGPHTLTASVTAIGGAVDGDNTNWYLDYFIVTQSAGTVVEQAMSFFDDTDPAFQYSGQWTTGGATSIHMQSTLHGALAMNCSATLSFTGSFINVYGKIPLTSGVENIAQFVVDDDQPIIATYPPVQNITFDRDGTAPNVRLFHNTTLSPGPHVMVITPLAEEVLYIDFATSGNGEDVTNTGNHVDDILSPSSTPAPSTPTPSPSISPSQTSLLDGSGHSDTGAIVGGVVGSIAGLALLALAIIFYMRRKRKHAKDMEELIPHQLPLPDHLAQEIPLSERLVPVRGSNDPQRVAPYVLKHDLVSPTTSDNTRSDTLSRGKGAASTISSRSEPASTSTNPVVTPVASSSALIPPQAVQHFDSGIRGLAVPDTVEEVPPLYTED